MKVKTQLLERSGGICELCENADQLEVYAVPPYSSGVDRSILACENCRKQISGTKLLDISHWRCLNKSMWSTVPAVQVVAWRVLNAMRQEGWPQDLLDMLYLEDEALEWAKASKETENAPSEDKVVHKDGNGTTLLAGDSVVLIKDLDVKGGGFTAKRGTPVRDIKLVGNNPDQIEGKISGQQIVILTKFVKKS
jgi:protein PhnA